MDASTSTSSASASASPALNGPLNSNTDLPALLHYSPQDQPVVAHPPTLQPNNDDEAAAGGQGGGGGQHICPTCQRTFATRRNLTRHAANHSTTKSYHCPHPSCTKSFARSDLLLRHRRLHDRPGGLIPSNGGGGGPGPAVLPLGAVKRVGEEENVRSTPATSSAPTTIPAQGFLAPSTSTSTSLPPSSLPPPTPSPAFPSPSSIASTHLPPTSSAAFPLPPVPASVSAPTPQPQPQYPPSTNGSSSTNEIFNSFVHSAGLWSVPSLSNTTTGEGGGVGGGFAPHPHALGGGGGGLGNLLSSNGGGAYAQQQQQQQQQDPFADLTNEGFSSSALGFGGLGFGAGAGAGGGAFGVNGFGFDDSSFGFGGSPFGTGTGGASGGGMGGLGGGMAPGWDSWDMSLAWLVEGAVSRVGSPVGGVGDLPPLPPPTSTDALPSTTTAAPSTSAQPPTLPPLGLSHPSLPPPPPSSTTSAPTPTPISAPTPSLPLAAAPSRPSAPRTVSSSYDPHLNSNLNTLASAAAAAVSSGHSMGGSPATSASALLGGGGGTPGDGGAGEGEGRTPDQGGGEGKGKVKEEEERDERWPTHFDPTREDRSPLSRSPSPPPAPAPAPAPAPLPPSPAVPSSSTATAEPSVPELTEPFAGSEKWKDVCWVDENVRGRVERVCELARFMPGGGERPFHFPQSLHTINHFLSNYFEYVLPLFPVVHLPTFSPPTSAPIVLAAQTCIGASFSPLPSAHKFSLDLAEQIRRALAALYEHDLRNLRSEEIMHAGLLTCVSGLWSGNKRAFELAEIARGQLVNLCRRGRLFDRPAIGRADGLGWTAWAAVESRKRLGACIMLLDGFFPSLLHTPSYISQGELSNMVFPCDERYWQATSAQQWQAMLGMAPIPPSPFFASCISTILTPRYVLHAPLPDPHLNPFGCLIIMTSLQHHIYELSQQLYTYMTAGITVPMYAGVPAYSETAPKPVNMALGFEGRKQWLKDALQLWRKHYAKEVQDPYMLWGQSLLWKGHMSLHVDVQDLNDAAGQHGAKAANAALGRLTKWAHSEDAVEASASAIQLLALLSTPSDLSSSHIGPYAPLCCFAATLTIWARLALGEKNSWDTQLAGRLVNMLGGVSLSSEEAPMAARRFGAGLLRKMKAWRIAESLESILLRIQ